MGSWARGSMLAPSLLAHDGLRWVSMNRPSTPVAMPARAIVSMRSGRPPVTPAGWLGCCRGVGGVEYHRHTELLHRRYAAIVYNKVLIAECGATLGHGHHVIACVANLGRGMLHGFGRETGLFLMLTIRPVFAAATSRSVCRHRNAGIWSISTYSAAISASSAVCMSVTTGTPKVSRTFRRMRRAFRRLCR